MFRTTVGLAISLAFYLASLIPLTAADENWEQCAVGCDNARGPARTKMEENVEEGGGTDKDERKGAEWIERLYHDCRKCCAAAHPNNSEIPSPSWSCNDELLDCAEDRTCGIPGY